MRARTGSGCRCRSDSQRKTLSASLTVEGRVTVVVPAAEREKGRRGRFRSPSRYRAESSAQSSWRLCLRWWSLRSRSRLGGLHVGGGSVSASWKLSSSKEKDTGWSFTEAEQCCSCGGGLRGSTGGLELGWPARYMLRCPQLRWMIGALDHPFINQRMKAGCPWERG